MVRAARMQEQRKMRNEIIHCQRHPLVHLIMSRATPHCLKLQRR